jgi:hypothetical protein
VAEKRHFDILFSFLLEHEKQAKKSQFFFFLALHLAPALELLSQVEPTYRPHRFNSSFLKKNRIKMMLFNSIFKKKDSNG